MSTDRYVSPLSERYASKEMQFIFSPDMKFQTWRKLWIALAETEKELGLKDADGNPRITDEQIEELKAHVTDINYDVAKARRKRGAPRRNEPCICIWQTVSKGSRNHSSWCYLMLCGG